MSAFIKCFLLAINHPLQMSTAIRISILIYVTTLNLFVGTYMPTLVMFNKLEVVGGI